MRYFSNNINFKYKIYLCIIIILFEQFEINFVYSIVGEFMFELNLLYEVRGEVFDMYIISV